MIWIWPGGKRRLPSLSLPEPTLSAFSRNKECPTCRKKLVSKRSLRPDPNFDALISKIYPSRDEYEAHQERVLARISKHNNQQALSHSIEEGLKIQAMQRWRASLWTGPLAVTVSFVCLFCSFPNRFIRKINRNWAQSVLCLNEPLSVLCRGDTRVVGGSTG